MKHRNELRKDLRTNGDGIQMVQIKPVEDFTVTLIDDQPWKISDQKGKVVVMQFSFTGCMPCKRMYRELKELKTEFGDRLQVLTLMRDEDLETTQRSAADEELTWPVALDQDSLLCDQWGVRGFPDVFLIDAQGCFVESGGLDRSRIASLLQPAG